MRFALLTLLILCSTTVIAEGIEVGVDVETAKCDPRASGNDTFR